VAQWNGTALPTTFISATRLTATVGSSLTASLGSFNITVVNPDGTASSPAVFVNTTYESLLIFLTPTSTVAGGPAFSLTVAAPVSFQLGVIEWNGSPLPTTHANGSMQATVPASLIATPGNAVITAAVGSLTSAPLTFSIVADTLISSVSPTSAASGGPEFWLTLNGYGFAPGSTVLWNGTSLGTAFVSTNQLTATVPANLIASPGNASLTVQMPSGWVLGPYPFTVITGPPVISSAGSLPRAVAG
jgi:hypothetical protein